MIWSFESSQFEASVILMSCDPTTRWWAKAQASIDGLIEGAKDGETLGSEVTGDTVGSSLEGETEGKTVGS